MSVARGTIMTRSYMPGFFEALDGLPETKVKKHFVTIEGEQYQVDLEKKLEIMKNGEENYFIEPAKFGPQIVLKPRPKANIVYPVLMKSEKGYEFLDGDIHWPDRSIEGGLSWQIERE